MKIIWLNGDGMADNKENIERRIRMLSMVDLFKGKNQKVLVGGLLCVVLLSALLLTSGMTKDKLPATNTEYNAAELFKFKTAYVGDNSNVVNLINNLPWADLRREVSLQTQTAPYGITVNYDFSKVDMDKGKTEATFYKNALILFSLIDNLDIIDFKAKQMDEETQYHYTRLELQKNVPQDLNECSKDLMTFEVFINNLDLKVVVFPEKYALTMSNTPGIRLSTKYNGPAADKVRFSTSYGTLLTWDSPGGKIHEFGQSVEVPYGSAVYWIPSKDKPLLKKGEVDSVIAAILKDDNVVVEKQIKIEYDGSTYYQVHSSPDIAFMCFEKPDTFFAKYIRDNPVLSNFPASSGTRDTTENGIRYIYQTIQSPASDGYKYLISFYKKKVDGTVVAQYQYYLVVNDPPQLKPTVGSY